MSTVTLLDPMTPTTDTDLIRQIVTDPSVWPDFGGVENPIAWDTPIHEGVIWLVEGGFLMAFFRHTPEWWAVHVGCLPEDRGDSVVKAFRGFRYMRENTPCRMVTGLVKTGNMPVKRLAEKVGMRVVSVFADQTFLVKEL